MKFKIISCLILNSNFLLHMQVSLAETTEIGKMPTQPTHLQKCSSSVTKAFLFFEVGTATLYADKCNNRLDSNTQKQLSFAYEREIPANAFSESSLNFLKKNLTSEDYKIMEDAFIKFNAAYLAVKKGDRYDILHTPGKGLSLYFNGERIAYNSSDLFAMAYFTIWFGDKPFNNGLKKNLMKGSQT